MTLTEIMTALTDELYATKAANEKLAARIETLERMADYRAGYTQNLKSRADDTDETLVTVACRLADLTEKVKGLEAELSIQAYGNQSLAEALEDRIRTLESGGYLKAA
jgi:chromosome segregation ATPase